MATRSFIGILNSDDSVTGVYCHWDGYPDGVGQVLAEHYTDRPRVIELIELGNLSTLGPRITPEPGVDHSFNNPAPGVTVAYGRDRGEKNTEAHTYRSISDLQRNVRNDFGAEYTYVMNHNGDWNTYT